MPKWRTASFFDQPLRLPSRKTWRRALKFLLASVLLTAVAIGCVEIWRQWMFAQARAQRNAALDRIDAHFAGVEDFATWFDSNTRGKQGGAAVFKAADEYEHTREWVNAANIPMHDIAMAVRENRNASHDPRGDKPGIELPPDAEVWNQYLVLTNPHARAAEDLLKYDRLHGTPTAHLSERDSISADFRGHYVLGLPCDRAGVLLYVGNHPEGLREALIAHRIGNRLMQPQCFAQTVSAEFMADCLHRLLVAILVTQRLTLDELAAFQAENAPVADYFHETLRGDLALIASRHRSGTYEYEYVSDYAFEGAFGWLCDRRFDVAETYDRYFTGAAAVYENEGAYHDSRLRQLALLDAGEVPNEDPVWESTRWQRADVWRVNLGREMSRALLEIREREAKGEAWNKIAGGLSAYPSLTITEEDGAILVGFKPTEDARCALHAATTADIPREHPPVALRPFK